MVPISIVLADGLSDQMKSLGKMRTILLEATGSSQFKAIVDAAHKTSKDINVNDPDYTKLFDGILAYQTKYGTSLNDIENVLALYAFPYLEEAPSLERDPNTGLVAHFKWVDPILTLVFSPDQYFKQRDMTKPSVPEKAIELAQTAVKDLLEVAEYHTVEQYLATHRGFECQVTLNTH